MNRTTQQFTGKKSIADSGQAIPTEPNTNHTQTQNWYIKSPMGYIDAGNVDKCNSGIDLTCFDNEHRLKYLITEITKSRYYP